jgi:Response regulator of the LytR/AlgR family
MLNLIICDNEEIHLNMLLDAVRSTTAAGSLRIQTAKGIEDIRTMLSEGAAIDILLTDIELDNGNAIDMVKGLHMQNPLTQVIYVTSYDKYHTKVYETDHAYFLQKPVNINDMEQALTLAMRRYEAQQKKYLGIIEKRRIERVNYAKIRYLESVGRKTTIYTDDGQVNISQKLSVVETLLGYSFLKCHKSFVVNMARVRQMMYGGFQLESGEAVPISQKMQKRVKDEFLKYIAMTDEQ